MERRTTTWAGLTLAIGIATYGCASTKVTSIVSPDAPRYGPGQIMIVASYADIGWRAGIEERFETEHVAFVPSIRLLGVGPVHAT